MIWHKVHLIYNKELKSLFRDKKALITIFIPILIYPVLMLFLIGFTFIAQSSLESQTSIIGYSAPFSPPLQALFEEQAEVVLMQTELTRLDLDAMDVLIEVSMKDDEVIFDLQYNSTIETSQQAMRRARDTLNQYSERLVSQNLEIVGMDQQALERVRIMSEDFSGEQDRRVFSMLLGMFLPFIIMLYGISGTFTISSDLSAGEKERETLETIFSVPVSRTELIVAKLLACVSVGMMSGLVNLLSLFPLIYGISVAMPSFTADLSVGLLGYIVLMLSPVMLLASTFFIGLGLVSRTYQESQSYGSIVYLLFMLPTFVVMIPEIELTNLTMMIPISNSLLLMKEAFLGAYDWTRTFIVLLYTLGLSAVGVYVMDRLFQSDWVIFGGRQS